MTVDQLDDEIQLSAFLLTVPSEATSIDGHYDKTTETWSDRKYANVAEKKHNEGM